VKHVKLEKFSTVVETLSISKPMAHIWGSMDDTSWLSAKKWWL